VRVAGGDGGGHGGGVVGAVVVDDKDLVVDARALEGRGQASGCRGQVVRLVVRRDEDG
jgi:hypothetical protein